MNTSTLRNAILIAVPLLVVAAVAAGAYMVVSGDSAPDLSKIKVEDGRVSCEAFDVARGYSFNSVVVLDLKDRPDDMEPTDPYRQEGFIYTTETSANVQGKDDIHANIYLKEQDQQQEFVIKDDVVYSSIDGKPWQEHSDQSFRILYTPANMCNAIAPDIFLSGMTGTPETVAGEPAIKYHFDALNSDFPDRHPAFGPQSDAAVYVNTFAGDIWVAEEGGYIVKLDLVGIGQYVNGRELEIDYSYQLYDVNKKIVVKAPI